MQRYYLTLWLWMCGMIAVLGNPVDNLLNRIDPGAAKKFKTELVKSEHDFFELDQSGKKVVVRGNTWVNIASGVNWYLKYYAGVHLTWNQMNAKLPAVLPKVEKKERHETNLTLRYDFNYCTFSYSMAFWDWKRWEKEIDWMALHGVNLPLAIVGEECVWRKMLLRLGYTEEEVGKFIAGPAFLAWWEMNNLEGWGGPLPLSWYDRQETLQKQILKRMKELGMHPVLPGYCGMVPHDAKERLGLNVAEAGLWNGFQRPANLLPTDKRFREIADIYYEELTKLFGKADYYSMDPFHESNDDSKLDYARAGQVLMEAMKAVNPKAVWVIQGWTENPRPAMVDGMKKGDLLILDLFFVSLGVHPLTSAQIPDYPFHDSLGHRETCGSSDRRNVPHNRESRREQDEDLKPPHVLWQHRHCRCPDSRQVVAVPYPFRMRNPYHGGANILVHPIPSHSP